MDPERWRRIEQLYHLALEQEPAEQNRLLADACQDDVKLRADVESLLAQSGNTERLVDQTAWAEADDLAAKGTVLASGARLGPYEILGLLGEGGMGKVYRGLDTRLNRAVAVKISTGQFSQRFEQEARAISALNHPHICTLYDIGAMPSGSGYMVTELVEGETLHDWLKRKPTVERRLEIARQILEALRAAHRAGIVHRDLKPQNIMVRFDGYVKVLDFGLAKQMPHHTPSQAGETATVSKSLPGQILGTVAYMSPEQIQDLNVDQRSDLFAFGIIFYEMLAGSHPWRRKSSVDTLHAILHDDPPPLDGSASLVNELAPIVYRLLCKIPAERYPLADAVLEALAGKGASKGSYAASNSSEKPLISIAVLPFVFLTEIQERKAFSLGFADALITTLGGLADVAVLPTSAILTYVGGTDPAYTCRDLGVRHVLQGTVQKVGLHWRVSMQLFDSVTQKVTFSEKHDFMREDIFEVQDEIGRRVVESLQTRFQHTPPKARDRYSSDPEAYGEFMTGLRESYGDSLEELQSAARHLSKAVERDPEFALAHAWLSHVSMQVYFAFEPKRTWLETAEQHYQRAVTLSPDLPEAHWARAAILWSPAKSFQHAEAIAALERVLEARPNFDRAHNRMAAICMHIGRFQDAQIADDRAQRCNPRNRSYNREFICQYSGDFAQAKAAGERWFSESPGNKNALWYSTHSLLLAGDLEAAGNRLTLALEKYPDEPLFISLQGMLHARRNQIGDALECVRKALDFPISFGHAHHTYHHVACVYALIGETEKAIAWLERSADTGFPCWPLFKLDPYLTNLREERAFNRLMADLERKWTALKIGRLHQPGSSPDGP